MIAKRIYISYLLFFVLFISCSKTEKTDIKDFAKRWQNNRANRDIVDFEYIQIYLVQHNLYQYDSITKYLGIPDSIWIDKRFSEVCYFYNYYDENSKVLNFETLVVSNKKKHIRYLQEY